MKTPLLLALLLMLFPLTPNSATSQDVSQVTVLSFKWARSRQTIENTASAGFAPAAALIPADKNYERQRRINDPAGARDPHADTIDGRSAALEKSVQESRAAKPVDGFAYRVKIQNASSKVIEVLFWEYQFKDPADPNTMSRRQFLCGVNIKPEKEKELQAFSLSGPTDVISVASLANKSKNVFQEAVVINRVEYADGTIWQRKDWNFGEVRLTYASALKTPWGTEMCRGL